MEPVSLAGQRVFVTGAHGFLGGHVLRALQTAGCAEIVGPTHAELELREPREVQAAFASTQPDVVIHLAARVGGIGANQEHPGTFWRDNTLMGVNVLEAARTAHVGRLVVVGTACAYPGSSPLPFREDELWSGFPEPTNAPYGVAKRALATGMAAYHDEFGLSGAYLVPTNLYGPGDNFDLKTSHVIPAMIRKCEAARTAREDVVALWGTGEPSREFLFVSDCAQAIVRAAAKIDDPSPLNLATGREVNMRELARLVADATGFEGTFTWDATRPDGQPRRALDPARAEEVLGWRATTPLEDGLDLTVAWYRAQRK